MAHRVGILNELKSTEMYNSNYTDILFHGAQPTTVNFSEREAFRHYLHCLKEQCAESSKDEDTKSYLQLIFDTALDLTSYFRQNGIRGKHRDFNNIGDSNLSVLDAFDNTRGLIFSANWQSI